jgi:hypothetical protein
MRETRFKNISGGIYHTILKKAKSTFVPGFLILPNEQYHNFCLLIVLYAWAPLLN